MRGKIHLWALVWNEIDLLPFFLEHYRPFVDRFFLYDDGSDDGSAEYLAQQPDVDLRRFANEGASFVETAQHFYNHAWKESRGQADWVIVVNVDELLHHPEPRLALERAREKNVTLVPARGWDIVSAAFPTSGPLVETTNRGVHSRLMCKTALFDPTAINEINYQPGRHHADPSGRVIWPRKPLFELLHYKYLGEDYLVRRYAQLAARMKAGDVAARYGTQYQAEEARLRAHQRRLVRAARPVLPADLRAEGWVSEPAAGVSETWLHSSKNAMGGLTEIWRADDAHTAPVDQVYVTTTLPGVVKAWYRHDQQVDQVTPLRGRTLMVFWDPARPEAEAVEVMLDAERPRLLTVAAGLWHGFRACGNEPSVLLHLNDRAFDWPAVDEQRLPPDSPAVPYRWDLEAPAA